MLHFYAFSRHMRKRLSITIALLFFTLTLFAQVRIQGKVTDAEGKGVPGISVSVRNTSLGTTTDANGDYTLDANLKKGTYDLEFSGIGYKTRTSSLSIGDATSYNVNNSLLQDALGLDEVVVTGTLGKILQATIGKCDLHCIGRGVTKYRCTKP